MNTEGYIKAMSSNNLAVEIQKLAKNIAYRDKWYRSKLLDEAARRLVAYRQAELLTNQKETPCSPP